MKKIALILAVALLSMAFLTGCEELDIIVDTLENGANINSGGENDQSQEPEVLPTFEELAAINSYDEIFKIHENMYFKNVCNATNTDESYVEDGVLMRGEGKVYYHMKSTRTVDGAVTQDVSRIGDEWYYVGENEPSYAVLELGETYVFDYTLPELFNVTPIGKAYLDGEQIVVHAYTIYEAFEEFTARRRDFTFYFNKETKLLEKLTATLYNNEHEIVATYVSDFSYGVQVGEIFESTLFDTVYASENRIELAIVVGHGTEDEKSYSLVATTDSVLYAVINSQTYLLYTDPEFQNQVDTLEAFAGEKTMTLYAKLLEFDE